MNAQCSRYGGMKFYLGVRSGVTRTESMLVYCMSEEPSPCCSLIWEQAQVSLLEGGTFKCLQPVAYSEQGDFHSQYNHLSWTHVWLESRE